MKINLAEVDHIAKLANLSFTEEEKQKFIGPLNSILEYVDQLNKLDTTGIQPTEQVVHTSKKNYSWNSDQVKSTFTQKQALDNGPEIGSGHFKVPKVISEK